MSDDRTEWERTLVKNNWYKNAYHELVNGLADTAALQADHARLTNELQAIKDTVGDEDFYLRQENARLREQLRLANIDAANNEARANDLQQQLAAAQGVWSDNLPDRKGWYSILGENGYQILYVSIHETGRPYSDCGFLDTGHLKFCGPIPLPRERIAELEGNFVIVHDQLKAAQGTWTKEKPTEAGWYWYRATPAREHWEICRVTEKTDLTAHFIDGQVEPVSFVHGEWCRIQEPREPDGKEGAPHAPR